MNLDVARLNLDEFGTVHGSLDATSVRQMLCCRAAKTYRRQRPCLMRSPWGFSATSRCGGDVGVGNECKSLFAFAP